MLKRMSGSDDVSTVQDFYNPGHRLDLHATLHSVIYGPGDPTFRLEGDGFWHGLHTPEGPATVHVQAGTGAERGRFRIRAWGTGSEWARATAPDLLGARDDWSGLDLSRSPRLAEMRRRNSGMYLARTNLVFDALVRAILAQKTTGRQARDSWRRLVAQYGAAAPGPAPHGLRIAPDAVAWGHIPSWAWHRAGVQPSQSRTVLAAARAAESINKFSSLEAADERVIIGLRSIPGVGAWTVAETIQRSHGDPDTISVGDYHLSKDIGWALAGKPTDDDGMIDLLEPWRGHRQRIVRLIMADGAGRPRRAPRITIQDHRNH